MSQADSATVLLALRLAGVAEANDLAARLGVEPEALEAVLAEAHAANHVRRGRGEDWALTPAGRVAGEVLLAERLADDNRGDVLEHAYEAFLQLNPRLLAICTAWQLRRVERVQVPNDHTDAGHDAGVLASLVQLHDEAQHVLRSLDGVPTFEGYGARLANALAQVQAGAVDYLVKPTVDSYHQVWFELHEHLLAALGLDRSDETQRIAAEHEEHDI